MRARIFGILMVLATGGVSHAQQAFVGRTLISPANSSSSFLIDMDGNTVKTWHGARPVALTAYMLPDESLLRPCQVFGGSFSGGGAGGRIQLISANDQVVWDFTYATSSYQQHHDVCPMPNGNVLLIAWERRSRTEAIAAGRQYISGDMWPTLIVEVEPVGATGGNIVWEWHFWDHLIQDVDPSKPSYGVIADHPELLDINYGSVMGGDWVHANAIDYHPELDQIVFSSHYMSEVYIIDHSTTTAEAAGHTGGRSGMGGDLLYRWGNPRVYDRGTTSDQRFYVVHGVNWIDAGLPGAGNLLAFNNGDRPGSSSDYSSVEEVVPPLNTDGTYTIESGRPYGPSAPTWSFSATTWFYSDHLAGAYRLPNGNTIVAEATSGYMFEVTQAGVIVWEYDYPAQVPRVHRYWTPGDLDGDGDVTLDDWAIFAACVSGPEAPSPGGCDNAYLDGDADVDLEDVAAFQRFFEG